MPKKDCKECLQCELDRLKKRIRELENELTLERLRSPSYIPYVPYPQPVPYDPYPWRWADKPHYEYTWTTCKTASLLDNDQTSLTVT